MKQKDELLRNLPYFNKSTLGEILDKSEENLNYWVKKMIKQGDLVVLKKGFYTTKLYLLGLEKNPLLRESYFEYLANVIRYPSYVSLEYALSKYGLIPEGVFGITSVTLKSSRTYKNSLGNFIYRNIKENLFFGFEDREFEGKRIKMATKEKALFDFLYLNKIKPFEDLRVNLNVFSPEEREKFVAVVKDSGSGKMRGVLRSLEW